MRAAYSFFYGNYGSRQNALFIYFFTFLQSSTSSLSAHMPNATLHSHEGVQKW